MDINNIQGARSDITEMLSKMREMSDKTKVFNEAGPAAPTESNSFESVLSAAKGVLSNVNQTQNAADKVRDAYISGDSTVSMSQVIMATQKSKLAFEGLMTVRNKILDAYKEIMNMQI